MKKVSVALLFSALVLGTASAQTQTTSELPESAQAVRHILESRGIQDFTTPVQLPALRGLPISDDLRALLPNAVWGNEMTAPVQRAVAPVAETTTPAPTAEAAPATTAEVVDSEESADILAALEEDGRFSIFLGLLNTASDEIKAAIMGDEYTLLIPTDEAMGKLDPLLVADIATDSQKKDLFISNHVFPGKVMLDGQPLTNVLDIELKDIKSSGEAIDAGMTRVYALDEDLLLQ